MNPKTFTFKKMICFHYKDSCSVFILFIVYYQKIMKEISLKSLKLFFLIVVYLIFLFIHFDIYAQNMLKI